MTEPSAWRIKVLQAMILILGVMLMLCMVLMEAVYGGPPTPYVTTTHPDRSPDSGLVFLGVSSEDYRAAVIIDPATGAVRYDRHIFSEPGHFRHAFDFKTAREWCSTCVVVHDQAGKQWFVWDIVSGKHQHTYRPVGFHGDHHDIAIMADKSAYLLLYEWRTMDLTPYGGLPNVLVQGSRIQHLNTQRQVLWQWSTFDHLDITETYVRLTQPTLDSCHGNTIDVHGATIMLSCRNMSLAVEIDRNTSQIIRRIGGKRSDVAFPDDPLGGFWWQHTTRYVGNNQYLIFDNRTAGGSPQPPQTGRFSRAVRYEIPSGKNVNARLVWEYRGPYASKMGSAQLLRNNTVVIGWGPLSSPALTHVDKGGNILYQINLPEGAWSYRAFRFPIAAPYRHYLPIMTK